MARDRPDFGEVTMQPEVFAIHLFFLYSYYLKLTQAAVFVPHPSLKKHFRNEYHGKGVHDEDIFFILLWVKDLAISELGFAKIC